MIRGRIHQVLSGRVIGVPRQNFPVGQIPTPPVLSIFTFAQEIGPSNRARVLGVQ